MSLYRYVRSNPISWFDPYGHELTVPDGADGPTQENPGRAICSRAGGHMFIRVFAYKRCATNGCDCGAGKKGCVDLHFDIIQGRSVQESSGDIGASCGDRPLIWLPATDPQNDRLKDYYNEKMKCGEGRWFTYSVWNSCIHRTLDDVDFALPKPKFDFGKCMKECRGSDRSAIKHRICRRNCQEKRAKCRGRVPYDGAPHPWNR